MALQRAPKHVIALPDETQTTPPAGKAVAAAQSTAGKATAAVPPTPTAGKAVATAGKAVAAQSTAGKATAAVPPTQPHQVGPSALDLTPTPHTKFFFHRAVAAAPQTPAGQGKAAVAAAPQTPEGKATAAEPPAPPEVPGPDPMGCRAQEIIRVLGGVSKIDS